MFLILYVYAIFWILGFYASLAVLPHRLEDASIRLRYGALAEGFVPYEQIESVERMRRNSPKGGEGLQFDPTEGAAYLAVGGKTDLTLNLRAPLTIEGLLRESPPATIVHLAVDEPQKLAEVLRRRLAAEAEEGVAT